MKGLRRYLVVSAILLVAYLLVQYYKPKPTNWKPTYLKEDKTPFGTYILFNRIHDLFPKGEIKVTRDPIYNTLKPVKYNNTSYLFVSSSVELDKLDFRELIKFVEQGNNAFIAAFAFGKVMSGRLKLELGVSYDDSPSEINFTSVNLKEDGYYSFEKRIAEQYFSKFDTSRTTILGKTSKGDPNFIRYRFGKGNIYLLPNPQLLTNYSLLNPLGADYAAKALSYLPASTNLVWDEYQTRGNVDDSAVLRVIFKNEPLRWAYYLALFGLVIFILFEMKRRQRIIPILEPLKNSSLDFVKVVGKVYYQKRDNGDIARKKVSYFLEYIRSSYNLKTTQLDDELKRLLIIRSGITEETADELFLAINKINLNQRVDDLTLISLNKLMEKFYKQSQ